MTDFELYEYSENKLKEAKKRIADLEKENAELKARVGLSIECDKAQKNGELCLDYGGDEDEPCEQCKNCIKCECGYYQLGETEKDEQLKQWKDEWQEQVQKATDEGYARTLQTIQLSKAKELLKQWVELYKPKLEGYPITPIQERTEQFLKDQEEEPCGQ